jgi:hypothetical protein
MAVADEQEIRSLYRSSPQTYQITKYPTKYQSKLVPLSMKTTSFLDKGSFKVD